MKRTMQRNLVLLFAAASVVPLILVSTLGYIMAIRSIVSLVERQATFSVRDIAQRFTTELTLRRNHFFLLMCGPGMLPEGWATRVRRGPSGLEFYTQDLRGGGGTERFYDRVLFVDNGGTPRYKIDYGLAPLSLESGRFFLQLQGLQSDDRRGFDQTRQLAAGRTAVLLPGPDSGTMEIRLGCTASGAEPLGVFLADVDASEILESILDGMSLGQDTDPFVVDTRNRIVLSHPDHARRSQTLQIAMPGLDGPSMPLGGARQTARRCRVSLW